ncbi:MAG: YciI family protein [Burkholderiales bacterium]|nr:YciI family protein [Burkholderiales bacterium]
MSEHHTTDIQTTVDAVHRTKSRRVFATLVRLLGDFDAAEEALHEGKVSITDGPFAETKEQLAGFYMIDAGDLNEAIRIASGIPPARVGSIEIRPIRPIRDTVAAAQQSKN